MNADPRVDDSVTVAALSPSAFATVGDVLFVVDLLARLTLIDPNGRLIGHLGDGGTVWGAQGWPNIGGGDGRVGVRLPHDA